MFVSLFDEVSKNWVLERRLILVFGFVGCIAEGFLYLSAEVVDFVVCWLWSVVGGLF